MNKLSLVGNLKWSRAVLGFSLIVFAGSLMNLAFYYGTMRPNSPIFFPTDFAINLLAIRIVVSLCLIGMAMGVFFRSKMVQILPIVSIVAVLILYAYWYYEKFKWLSIQGYAEKTTEYARVLSETGYFREANYWDYFVLFYTFAMLLLFLVRNFKPPRTGLS